MIRSTRTLATVLLATTIGFTAIGASPASAASNDDNNGFPNNSTGACQTPGNTGANSFLPPATAGRITSDMGGSVFITNPGTGGRDSWDRLFSYLGGEAGGQVAEDLNDALHKAEEQFDKKGKGNTSSTSDNKFFKTEQVKGGFAVRSTSGGGVAGVYKSKDKANAVANALEEEMSKKTEELDSEGDPCVLIFDPRTELPY